MIINQLLLGIPSFQTDGMSTQDFVPWFVHMAGIYHWYRWIILGTPLKKTLDLGVTLLSTLDGKDTKGPSQTSRIVGISQERLSTSIYYPL